MKPGRKIRFVEPQGRPGRPFNAWLRWPLLGPITLASILHERGYDVAVYNENASGPLDQSPAIWADLCSSDVVGISIMTPTAVRGYELARRLRADAPAATIAFGGVHATFRPQEARQFGDLVVCGEAERVIAQIADGEIREGIIRPAPLENLDELPFLRHELMHDFDKLIARRRRREYYELPLMTSRGCPHNCTYCSVTPMFGRQVRRQSPQRVQREVQHHHDRGFRRLFFYDDNFTSDRTRSRALLERLAELNVRFNAQARADLHWLDGRREKLDRPLLDALARGGADVLYIGYETIDDATAAGWNKGYRGQDPLRQRLLQDSRILHDYGFWLHGMFVLGPDDDEAAAGRIVQFGRDAKLETLQISILTPMPGTALFEDLADRLILRDFPRDWDYFDGAHCVYRDGVLNPETAARALLRAHRRFYRWGGWSLRRLQGCLREQIGLIDTISNLLLQARVARSTLKQWRSETRSFLSSIESRQRQCERNP